MEIEIFATYDSEGNYTGFYDTDYWEYENIPIPHIQLTEEQRNHTFECRCRVVNGVHTVIPFTEEELNEQKLTAIRFERNKLLKESDWTQMSGDIPLPEEKKVEWQVYRQALRDLPQTVDLNNIVYPTPPL